MQAYWKIGLKSISRPGLRGHGPSLAECPYPGAMKKTIAYTTTAILCFATTICGQARKKTTRGAPPRTSQQRKTPPAPPPITGAQVAISTKAGEQIIGQVLEIGAYKIRVKQGDLESTVPLESISSITFGDVVAPVQPSPAPLAAHSPNFSRDAGSVIALLQAMDSATASGTEYGDYSRQLAELRRATERFVNKYANSDDPLETKMAVLLSAAADDYSRARTIWTLKLGQGAGATVAVSDSPAVADAVELYPDLAQLGSRNKLPADKLVAGLWKHAALQAGRARGILEQAR